MGPFIVNSSCAVGMSIRIVSSLSILLYSMDLPVEWMWSTCLFHSRPESSFTINVMMTPCSHLFPGHDFVPLHISFLLNVDCDFSFVLSVSEECDPMHSSA